MRQPAKTLSAFMLALALGFAPLAPAFAETHAPEDGAMSTAEVNEVHEGDPAKEGLPQFDTSRFPSQIFWLVITFGITYALMRYVALPDVEQTMGIREKRIKADIEEAKSLNEQAKKMAAEYESRLNAARSQAQEVYRLSSEENARKAASRTAQQNEMLEIRLREAEDHIEGLKRAALADLDQEVESVVTQLISKVAGQAPKPDAVKAAIRAVKEA